MQKIWAIFIIHYGVKMYVTKIDDYNRIHEFAKVKYSNDNVQKFDKETAIEIINAQTGKMFHSYGITAHNGYQEIVSKSVYKKN